MGKLRIAQASHKVVEKNPRFQRISWGHLLVHFVLLFMGIVWILPFLWMVATSLKGYQELFSFTPTFLPKSWKWENYLEAFEFIPFARFYFNTAAITIFRVLGQVLLSAMAGFAFARLRFPGRNILFILCIISLMVPFQVTLIPNYILLRKLNWLDTYVGLIVPTLVSTFGIFLLRQFYLTIPQDYIDSATLDGCNPFQIFWNIAIPLSRSTLITFGLLVTLWSWNDFLWPLIVSTSTDMQTLSVGIAYFQGQYVSNYGVMMAASAMATLPMIVIYIFVQRQMIEGITMSGLKM